MKSPGEGFTLDQLFYSLGYALEEARTLLGDLPVELEDGESTTSGAPQATPANSGTEPPTPAAPAAPRHPGVDAGAALATTAVGWLLARVFRPRRVRWSRAILAGVAGTALAELTGLLEPHGAAERPVFPPRPEDIPRYAAGIITAAAYASVFYPRLPGSSLTRGLTFGALETATRNSGGAVGLLRRIAPDTSFPLETFMLPGLPRVGPLAGLAYGIGLGLYADND